MKKNDIKKIILSIVFIALLIMFFLIEKNLTENKNIKKISIVKNIIREKYDRVFYNRDSKYVYALNNDDIFIYDVFDLHGNKIYSIKSDKELNIVSVMKKYYITYDNEYHLYSSNNEEIVSSSVIESLNEYLIKVDNNIINCDNEIIFEDVHDIKKYSNDKYLNINNYYLVNKKGEILYENVIIEEEIKNHSITDYLIIKKDNKYYTFFISIDKIIGDGFDTYYIDKDIFIKNNNTIYKVYKTGLRKKMNTISSEINNKYNSYDKIILINKMFVTRKKDNYFGILSLKTNKFNKITKNNIKVIKKIDDNNYLIKAENNIVYNINNNKVSYITNSKLDNIIIFKKGYKTIKKGNIYILLDSNDKEIISLDKQIVINDKIVCGKTENEIYLYDLNKKKKELYNRIYINKKVYYYKDNELFDTSFKKIIKSNNIMFDKNTIIYQKDKKLFFDNKKDLKKNEYNLLKNEQIINNYNLGRIVLIESDQYIKVLDNKGNLIKKIKNKKVVNYYSLKTGQIIIITGFDKDRIYYGSYLAE